MKFFRLDLLTLLISLFILSSCKNQDGIGLTPDQSLSGTLLVDDNIVVNTVLEDSVYTNALSKTPLGYFNDPQIGTTESNDALLMSLPAGAAYTIPSGTLTVDSAVLVLRYADGSYGDSLNSKYKLNVYQLQEKPSATINYYNTKAWKYDNSVVLGTRTFNARTHTSFKITDIVAGAKDTLKIVPPQLRVPMDKNFIYNLLFSPSAVVSSNTGFQDALKGFYLTMDKGQTGPGGNLMLQLDSSTVDIYYRTDNSGTLDTAVVSLPVSAHAANIKHTYTTTVQGVLNNQATSNSVFYIQGLLGLKAKVSFPGLANIITQAGSDIVVNRAEVVITPEARSTIPFAAQPKLTMYQLDIAKQRIPLQDGTSGQPTGSDPRALGVDIFGGFYSLKNDYHFIVTAYIQDLIKGRTKDYGTYIGAVDTTNTTSVDYLSTPQTAGRLVATGSVTNTAAANYPYRIKLNLIYTKVNK